MITDNDFRLEFYKRYGIPLEHVKFRFGAWAVSVWDRLEFESQNISTISQMEKLQSEANNNPHSTVQRLQHIQKKFNILLNTGITASGQRDTNENTDTGVSHLGVGTDGTAESSSQTGLIVAYGSRKTLASRSCANQISSYFVTISESDITYPVTIKEAATYNASSGGTAHARIQYPDIALTTGNIASFQIYEYMVNG